MVARIAVDPSEKRQSPRTEVRESALVGGKRASRAKCVDAVVEDRSVAGMRIRSGRAVQSGEVLQLYVGRDDQPYVAEVVWAQRAGFFSSRRTGKLGNGYVAGCRVRPVVEKPQARRAAAARTTEFGAPMMRVGVVIAFLVVAGLVAYGLIAMLSMMG